MYCASITIFILLNLVTASENNGRRSLRFSVDLRQERGLDEFRCPSHTQIDLSDSEATPSWTIQARPTIVHRPRSQAGLQRARLRSLRYSESEKVEWESVETFGPDIEDRQTLAQLARMTGNAYALPGENNWYEIEPKWNNVCIFTALTMSF